MSWNAYVDNLMDGGSVEDAAIVGCEDTKECVWAATPGGCLSKITPAEIRKLMTTDRGSLFAGGVVIAGTKCTVLRDSLNEDGQFTMDVKTKASDQDPDTYSISIGKSKQTLVIVKGKKDTHGGQLNKKAFCMADHLRKSNY